MAPESLSIAIPASVTSDTPHLREKTAKIGLIGRAAAIFRANEIIVYLDNPNENQARDAELLSDLLSYMETPQYLRKRLFPMNPLLQYAGILPPLRTPHHPLERRIKNLKDGEHREGVTISTSKEGTLVDIGVEQACVLAGEPLNAGKRITVQIVKQNGKATLKLSDPKTIKKYWGFKVTSHGQSLLDVIRSRKFDMSIATSKLGTLILNVMDEISAKSKEAKTFMVCFGSPPRGLHDIARSGNFKLADFFDFVVNTVPFQATETVRTEEAVFASLAVFNVLWSKRA